MPRQGRLHIPGAYYHVMGRGLERRRIFQTSSDKKEFLSRLAERLGDTGLQCMAWSLMPNHYHLLVRVNEIALGQTMQSLLGGYASYYNRQHKRVGYVFQNRYKSILCNEENYFLALVRYIHLNPVKARLIDSIDQLDRYPWTGHSCLMGKQTNEWQNVIVVLERFAGIKRNRIAAYRQFMCEKVSRSESNILEGGGLIRSYGGWENTVSIRSEHQIRIGDERILGESEFVQAVLEHDDLRLLHKTALENAGWDIEKVIKHTCERMGVDEELLTYKGRNNTLSHARSLICYFLNKELRLSSTVISNRLSISQPAVSQAAKRGAQLKKELGLELLY